MYGTSQGYSSGGCRGNSCSYSPLEKIAQTYSPNNFNSTFYSASAALTPAALDSPLSFYQQFDYNWVNQNNLVNYDFFKAEKNYNFIPDNFLKPGKEGTFVGKAEEIKPFILEAFEKMFDSIFPNNIKISVLDQAKFKKIAPSPATLGLSINRNRQGFVSEIFVLNGTLARVMLTIGHELGHVLTETLPNPQDEEAKAYAFSLAWMQIIQEHNIGNLGNSFITETPANNGLHNVAFEFVHKLIKQGRKAWEVYLGLVKRNILLS